MNKQSLNYQYYFEKLKKSQNFSGLSDAVLEEILKVFYLETWKKGQLFVNGDKTLHKLYFIVSGRIKMYQIHPENGNEYTININTAGDIFDVICLLDGKRHKIEMEALDDIVLLVAPIDIVREWINKHPNFNKTLLPYIAKQLREMEEKANDLALFDTWTRTLKLFIKHTNNSIKDSKLELINDLSHNEIAKIIGTSRNIINKHIQKLKNEDILHINRKNIEVKNLKALIKKLK